MSIDPNILVIFTQKNYFLPMVKKDFLIFWSTGFQMLIGPVEMHFGRQTQQT